MNKILISTLVVCTVLSTGTSAYLITHQQPPNLGNLGAGCPANQQQKDVSAEVTPDVSPLATPVGPHGSDRALDLKLEEPKVQGTENNTDHEPKDRAIPKLQ